MIKITQSIPFLWWFRETPAGSSIKYQCLTFVPFASPQTLVFFVYRPWRTAAALCRREGVTALAAVRLEGNDRLNERARRKAQHELKIYMEKYFKSKLGKGVDHTRVNIWEDVVIIRGEGFLTDPEKYIVETAAGKDVVNSARIHVAKQHAIDNVPYIERMLNAKVVHQSFLVEAEKDFWMHVMILDRTVTQELSPTNK
jgi:uncharacterized protein YbcI